MNKVYDGTPMSGPNLCESCQQGVVVKGYNMRQGIHCAWMGRLIHFSVRQCSRYVNAATPDLVEMKKIAWVIESRNRGPWGFKGENQTEIVVRPPGTGDENAPTQGPV